MIQHPTLYIAMGRLRAGVVALAPVTEPTPAAILDAYTHCATLNEISFATAACVVIDTETGNISYSLAGHPPPLVINPDGTHAWLNIAPAPPIAAGEICSFVNHPARLRPGAREAGHHQQVEV